MKPDIEHQESKMKVVDFPSSVNKLTPLAHAVRFAMRCGINDVQELARECQCTTSAIYRALRQLKDADRTVTSDRRELTVQSQTDRTVTKSDRAVTSQPAESRARAYKEYPSGIVTLEASKLARREREIVGLNGSTGKWVNQLAVWLAGDLGFPDQESAFRILESTVEVYGPDKVRAGMTELQTQIAAGNKPHNLARAFSGFVKHAKTGPSPQQKKPQTLWEILQAEEAEKAAAGGVA